MTLIFSILLIILVIWVITWVSIKVAGKYGTIAGLITVFVLTVGAQFVAEAIQGNSLSGAPGGQQNITIVEEDEE